MVMPYSRLVQLSVPRISRGGIDEEKKTRMIGVRKKRRRQEENGAA
jgi:hypothetical protein